ncbi:penicillin-binding protein 2 [uncultured Duncaniella sp.]|uniref:penicillin-binding protein 2 n=1 Tax=uncultured Duncaniella sp. TaxID=2768039 RepID=UPI002674E2E2|nr:penicillin-binding protein 2 [uncultured Duncaniella sp.]MCI9172623.1 penicillin-binding protein 2 [Muribaculaceae bacterium]
MRKDYNLAKRQYVIGGFIVIIAIIYVIRLFGLQVMEAKYKDFADSNAFLRKAVYPSRGIIYDRDGRLVVFNQPAYDVMVIPRDIKDFDTIDFCNAVNITPEDLVKRMADMRDKRRNPGWSPYSPQKLLTHLSAEEYGRLQEKLYRFPGFYIQKRILREYNYKCASNVLGNIREVAPADMEKDPYYMRGDYMGDIGVEHTYERFLRGVKGTEVLMRDALGRIQGRYEEGALDREAVAGKNIKLSLNIELQQYAESLMVNKKGAVVAIEPSTGEVLCLVTAPTYDPTLLVGRDRGNNYNKMMGDLDKPLLNRAIQATYPPGSTFKPTQGLIFLQEGIITPSTPYPCYHGFVLGRLKVGCHGHGSPLPLKPALQTSCNAYFCWGLKNMIDKKSKYGTSAKAFDIWKHHMISQGYGYKLGIDLPGEYRGFIPNVEFYNKRYGDGHWSATTIISIAIGQGEILATPLQIANLSATIANRGHYITPHVVKEIQDTVVPGEYLERHDTSIDRKWYEQVAEGMRMAVTGGTCRVANLPDIEVCGKTGTAQNPHGRDHSAFMGFAPYHEPKIAVAVYVENAGFGATFGVPIGSLVMEKYLRGYIPPERKYLEERMLQSNTIQYAGTKKH